MEVYFPGQPYWSKDIVFLVSDHEQIGMQAWLDGYHQVDAQCKLPLIHYLLPPGTVSQSDVRPPGMQMVAGSILMSGKNILSLRFGHEKFSTTILSLSLIQEGQLSVTDERMCTKYW